MGANGFRTGVGAGASHGWREGRLGEMGADHEYAGERWMCQCGAVGMMHGKKG